MFNPEMLITARLVRGLTREQLGELSGLGFMRVRYIEEGKVRPSKNAIRALADVLRFPVGFFRQTGKHHPVYPLSGPDDPMTGWID